MLDNKTDVMIHEFMDMLDHSYEYKTSNERNKIERKIRDIAESAVKNLNIPAVKPSLPLEVISLLKQVRFTFSNYESGTIGKRMSEDAYSLLKKYVGNYA